MCIHNIVLKHTMAELNEQQTHLASLLKQREEIVNEINELTAKAITCYNENRPLESIGFYFGCYRMLQYSISTKKDGRIKTSPKKLIFNINKIYYRPKFNDNKHYINRKTLELRNPFHDLIGQCKIENKPEDINKSLEIILKNNTSKNKL